MERDDRAGLRGLAFRRGGAAARRARARVPLSQPSHHEEISCSPLRKECSGQPQTLLVIAGLDPATHSVTSTKPRRLERMPDLAAAHGAGYSGAGAPRKTPEFRDFACDLPSSLMRLVHSSIALPYLLQRSEAAISGLPSLGVSSLDLGPHGTPLRLFFRLRSGARRARRGKPCDRHVTGRRSCPSTSASSACSAEGAALCYRTICTEGAALLGPHAHPEVSMHTPSLADYMSRLYRGDWPGVGELMLASAEKLAKIGADFLISPDNTIHQALPFIEPRLPLPWLHIAESSPRRLTRAASGASA